MKINELKNWHGVCYPAHTNEKSTHGDIGLLEKFD
jgi:hypothetical protein